MDIIIFVTVVIIVIFVTVVIIVITTILIIIRETVEHVRLAVVVEDLAAQGERQVVATRYNRCNMMVIMTKVVLPNIKTQFGYCHRRRERQQSPILKTFLSSLHPREHTEGNHHKHPHHRIEIL